MRPLLLLVLIFILPGMTGCSVFWLEDSWQQRVRDVEKKVDELEEDQARQDADMLALKSEMQARDSLVVNVDAGTHTQPEKPGPKPTYTKPKPKPNTKTPSGKARYEQALALVMAGKSAQGRKELTAFLADYPSSSLAPNALYWIGESYYDEKNYAQAILAFKEVRRKYPKSAKAPDAMLKTGYSYEKLGDTSNARFYLQALLNEYPAGKPAGLARKKLTALGG